MSYKTTVVLALTIALFGHLVAAGRTLHDQATHTDASGVESRKLLQQYGANTVYDGSAETITGASDLIAQAVAAGAQPEATAAAATRRAEYASLATQDNLAGTPDTGARRLLRGSSVAKAAQSSIEVSPVAAQAVVAGAQPDVRSSAMKAGADFLKLSTVDAQPWKADPNLVRKRSVLQRVFSSDKPDHSRPLLGAASGVPAASDSAVAGVRSDVKSSSMKAGADYLKLSTLDPQMMLPKEHPGAHKRSLLQRYEGDEWASTYALNESADVIEKAADSGANPAVTKWATGRAAYYARLASLRGGAGRMMILTASKRA